MLQRLMNLLRRCDPCLAAFTVIAFVLWMGSVGPLRSWATEAGVREHWTFGVAPSLFAGATLTGWQSLGGTPPLASALLASLLIVLAEAAHLFMPRQTADGWDVLAGLMGAAVALPFVWWRFVQSCNSEQ